MKYIKSALPIQLFEKKYFTLAVAERTMAEIEILCFKEDCYGAQATITATGKKISTASNGNGYSKTLEDSLQRIVAQVEKEFKDDEWVQKTITNLK